MFENNNLFYLHFSYIYGFDGFEAEMELITDPTQKDVLMLIIVVSR